MKVTVVPRMFDTINNRARYDTLNGLPVQSFATVNPRGIQFAVKHALDRILALLLLIILSPLMIAIAIAIKLTSPGPALFTQERIGRNGRAFKFLKYRTMQTTTHPQSEIPHPPLFQPPNETAPGGIEGTDRRTTIGRFLRKTSLDELPQLLNVLRGDMSLVGPRPERPGYVAIFKHNIERYDERHRVKPGITGWAQINGLRGQTSLPERIELDSYYIAHWSLTLDLKILTLTPLALLRNAK
jgi:exopolysaccharide biosynthesis polyprenyl glycosylphosphotransferase